jgi:hypothetical protein
MRHHQLLVTFVFRTAKRPKRLRALAFGAWRCYRKWLRRHRAPPDASPPAASRPGAAGAAGAPLAPLALLALLVLPQARL